MEYGCSKFRSGTLHSIHKRLDCRLDDVSDEKRDERNSFIVRDEK